jgi:hypothetical protein
VVERLCYPIVAACALVVSDPGEQCCLLDARGSGGESASVEDGEGELGMHTTRVIYFLERFGQSEHSRSPQRVARLRLCRFGEAGPRRA